MCQSNRITATVKVTLTTIRVTRTRPLQGRTNTGRPVAFSLAMWCWFYTDTRASDPVEKIRDQFRVVR